MAFKLDDFVIDRILYGVAENFDGDLLFVLTQLSDATINVTAESKDAVDMNGTLIKRFYTGKSGEFSCTNALLNFNVLGEESGSGKQVATTGSTIEMPKIIKVQTGQTVTLTGYVTDSVKVYGISTNGTMGKEYTKATTASANQYAITSEGVLTAPTSDAEDMTFIVKYQRTVSEGIAIHNSADKFPSTIRLTLKVIGVDPCSADTVRAMYVEFPSFQISPEVDLSLNTDSGISFNGTLQVDYCSVDKALYNIYFAPEDTEEDT